MKTSWKQLCHQGSTIDKFSTRTKTPTCSLIFWGAADNKGVNWICSSCFLENNQIRSVAPAILAYSSTRCDCLRSSWFYSKIKNKGIEVKDSITCTYSCYIRKTQMNLRCTFTSNVYIFFHVQLKYYASTSSLKRKILCRQTNRTALEVNTIFHVFMLCNSYVQLLFCCFKFFFLWVY